MKIDVLKGKEVEIQISEPWDFKLPRRGKTIDGIIEGVCIPTDKKFESEYPLILISHQFVWQKKKIRQLIVSPRYEHESIENINRKDGVTANIAYVKPNCLLVAGMNFKFDQINYFAIGSIRLK